MSTSASFSGRGGLAHRRDGRLTERVVSLDQRHQLRAGDGHDGDAGIERPDQRLVAAARDGRLGREQADATVARSAHGGVCLGLDHAEHRHRQRPLQVGQRRGGRRVARGDDELDALLLEVAGDLAGEATDLVERPRAVRQARSVAEIDEVLVRHRHQALVKDGEPTGTGVEHADRAGIHGRECRRGGGGALLAPRPPPRPSHMSTVSYTSTLPLPPSRIGQPSAFASASSRLPAVTIE